MSQKEIEKRLVGRTIVAVEITEVDPIGCFEGTIRFDDGSTISASGGHDGEGLFWIDSPGPDDKAG